MLKSINKKAKCVVQMTLTTYDEELCKIIEPNVSTTKERFEVLKIMRDNGIPTVVWLTPILPYINGRLFCITRISVTSHKIRRNFSQDLPHLVTRYQAS